MHESYLITTSLSSSYCGKCFPRKTKSIQKSLQAGRNLVTVVGAMTKQLIEQYIAENSDYQALTLLDGAEDQFVGLGYQFSNDGVALYVRGANTCALFDALVTDGGAPMLLTVYDEPLDLNRKVINEWLENYFPNIRFLLADGMDPAFIGAVEDGHGRQAIAAYDRTVCISCLIEQGMEAEEAEEFFEYNTQGAWLGELTPMFVDCAKYFEEPINEDTNTQGAWLGGPTPMFVDCAKYFEEPINEDTDSDEPRAWIAFEQLDGAKIAVMGDEDSATIEVSRTLLSCITFEPLEPAKQLAEWLRNPEYDTAPEWATRMIPSAGVWICVHEDYPGMCLKISGPFADSRPELAFGGMPSGYWKDRHDPEAVLRRHEIAEMLTAISIVD